MFGFLASLASSLIPGVGPLIGLASSAVRAFSGGGGGGAPLVPDVPLPPPPPPFDPRVGTVTPVAEMNGGGSLNVGAPFIGDPLTAPIPDGFGSSGRSEGGMLPSGGGIETTAIPGFADPLAGGGSAGGFNLPALISGAGNIIQQVPGLVQQIMTPQNLAIAGAAVGGVGLAALAVRMLPKVLVGTAVGQSVSALYTALRQRGMSHRTARRTALAAHGIRLRRRRMRPTNVHALRRAIRRVRGARRILGKVRALHVGGRGGSFRPIRRRYRRGDLNPFMVEDRLEAMDEWEDAGGDDRPFSGDEAAG
jgi:hypothetical protein